MMSYAATKPEPTVVAALQPHNNRKAVKGNLRTSRDDIDDETAIEGAIAQMRPSVGLNDPEKAALRHSSD